jgi:hypothetical protein
MVIQQMQIVVFIGKAYGAGRGFGQGWGWLG